MPNQKRRLIDTVQKPTTAQITRTNIPITEVIKSLNLRLAGTVSVDGAGADGVLTLEGQLSLIKNVTIVGTSSSRTQVGNIKSADFAAMWTLQNYLRNTPPDRLVPTPITKGSVASPFYVDLPIDFAMAFSQDPRLTLLNTRELTSLAVLLDWGTSAEMFSAGTITYPSCAVTITADEFTDESSKLIKYGLNQFSMLEYSTAAANARMAIDLKRGYMLRGLLVKQFTRNAVNYHTPVETVINRVALELNRDKIADFSFAELKSANKADYGMASLPTGYAFLDLMPEGRFDTIVDTRNFNDVNVILDVNGVANSYVRIYPVEIIPANV